MPEVQKYSLTEELRYANEHIRNDLALVGMTVLTFPQYMSAMRANMLTSHLKQCLTLTDSDFPYLFTGAEILVGKKSSGYRKENEKIRVVAKVEKFKGLVDKPRVYHLFIFDMEKQRFEVIERKPLENLTENFGFLYDNHVIDSLKEGDEVDRGSVLYKSVSYDDDMKYSFGRNVKTMYTLDPFTTEDAAVVSKSFAQKMTSIETERITVGLNDNDYLLNLYGLRGDITEENYLDYYKPLPDIGSKVSGILLATRRQFNNQLLFDFKIDSLNEIHEGDDVRYIGIDHEILDYTIYNNNEEIKDTSFNRQVNILLKHQNAYYEQLRDVCHDIMHSGFDFSNDIRYLYKRSKEMLDTKMKWKDGDSAFSNMVIDILTKKIVPLSKGQKITG